MGKSRVLSRQLHSIGVPPGAYGHLAENRKPGVNPGRYRHCKRGGRVQDESQSLGKFPEKACPDRRSASQETCSRCMECSLFSCVRTGVFVLLTEKRPEAVRFGLLPADFFVWAVPPFGPVCGGLPMCRRRFPPLRRRTWRPVENLGFCALVTAGTARTGMEIDTKPPVRRFAKFVFQEINGGLL